MANGVIHVDTNSNDKTTLSPLTDDSFIEYNSKVITTNSSLNKKDSWWNKKLKETFQKSDDIATKIIIEIK